MATRGTSDINLSCHCIDRKSTRLNSSHSLHDALPIAVKLSGLLPVEEIHEAVKVLGHEDGYARNLRHQLELPLHRSEEHTSELQSLPTRRSSDRSEALRPVAGRGDPRGSEGAGTRRWLREEPPTST